MISQQGTFIRVLPTKWRRKPAGIDVQRNYATVTLCIKGWLQRSTKETCMWSIVKMLYLFKQLTRRSVHMYFPVASYRKADMRYSLI